MTRELKVGVIGAGHWATEAHIPGFQACEGVAVVAVSDIEAERAARAAQALGVPRAYASAEEMLAAETLDAVSIVTPDDTHAGYALAAMARGIAVLCEKPLARTAKEALALADRAEQAGVVNKVGFTMRYTPSLLYLRELVEQGFFGELYLFQCFIQNAQFLDPQKPRHWKMTMEHAGGGVIVEYGIHMLDIARLLVGDIRRVSAKARTFVPERPAADGRGRVPVEVDRFLRLAHGFRQWGVGQRSRRLDHDRPPAGYGDPHLRLAGGRAGRALRRPARQREPAHRDSA